jgi:hypothetical protein
MATEVGPPDGKPRAPRLGTYRHHRHRASSRPYTGPSLFSVC